MTKEENIQIFVISYYILFALLSGFAGVFFSLYSTLLDSEYVYLLLGFAVYGFLTVLYELVEASPVIGPTMPKSLSKILYINHWLPCIIGVICILSIFYPVPIVLSTWITFVISYLVTLSYLFIALTHSE